MSAARSPAARPDWRAALAASAYAALVAGLAIAAYGVVAELAAQRDAVVAAEDRLARLQGRTTPPAGVPSGLPAGSPFVEGPTLTVAGAALMQRISGAADRAEGRITSSQVALQGNEFGPGFVGVTANLEIAQPELQRLLYDLEAGMPFLFIDQFAGQAPTAGADSEDGRMRVQLTVYGQWQGAR